LLFVLGDNLLLRLEGDFLLMQRHFEFLDRVLRLMEEFFLLGGFFLMGFDGLRTAVDLSPQIFGVSVQAMKLSQKSCRSRHDFRYSS